MQNTFTVSPMIQKIALESGQVYHGSITVANPAAATEDFHFKVSISPYSVSGTDYKPDFETESDWSRIVKWTELETTEGILKPNETKKINFTITVPKDAPAGGQYATIGVSSNTDVNGNGGAAVQNIFEMASLLYAEVSGEIVREGKIEKNYIPGFVVIGEPSTEVGFSNGGNIHEVATTTLSVKNVMTGETILPTDKEDGVYEATIMPDSTRVLTRDIDGLAALGIYEVKQEVSYMGEESTVSTIMIICPLWFIGLVVLTIASIIGMIFYSRHLRRKRALKMEQSYSDKNL